MTLTLELVLAMVAFVLQAALVYFIAPPRVGVVGRIVDGPGGRVLRLAIQSLERRQTVGPFCVQLTPRLPGGVLPTATHIDAYIGTQHDFERLKVTRGGRGVITIEVAAIRPTKTWVIVFPCTPATTEFDCRVYGPRRKLSLVFPFLDELAVGARRPGTFEFAFRIRKSGQTPSRAFYGQWRVLVATILLALTFY